jgi:hypothetical protein
MVRQDTTDEGPYDDEEYTAAHAGRMIADARAITAEGRR